MAHPPRKPTWPTEEGSGFVNRHDAGATPAVGSFHPGGATDKHQTLRRSGSGFESRPGFEARDEGREASEQTAGVLLAPRLSPLIRRWSLMARQPAANRSKWVRFPPASLLLEQVADQ